MMALDSERHDDYQSPSQRVIYSVSKQVNTDPLELPPLYDTIDPDVLDAAVDGLEDGEIQFNYAGQSVTVHGDGTVNVTKIPKHDARQRGRATDD